ncbi:MAG: DUF2283 domain-containing protein [Nanoarchaeota archaeon]|nr:DUF2283 domain-containing protein [Nanoarchaeota archaeon]
MKMIFDKEADAVYIYLKDILKGEVKKTISLNDSINIDLGENDKALGIEVLDASKNLPLSALKSATAI